MDPFVVPDPDSLLQLVSAAAESGRIETGCAQAVRAMEQGKARIVVSADDVDPNLTAVVRQVANVAGVPVMSVPSRAALGRAAHIGTGASAVAVVRFGGDPVGDLAADTLVSTARGMDVLPYLARVDKALRFQRQFVDPLLSAEKTATMRLGLRVPSSFELPLITSDTNETFANVQMLEMGWLQFGDVANRPDILQAEWPTTYSELTDAMIGIYGPTFGDSTFVTYYRFTLTS